MALGYPIRVKKSLSIVIGLEASIPIKRFFVSLNFAPNTIPYNSYIKESALPLLVSRMQAGI